MYTFDGYLSLEALFQYDKIYDPKKSILAVWKFFPLLCFPKVCFLPERGVFGICALCSVCHAVPKDKALISAEADFPNTTLLCSASSKDFQSKVKQKYVY